MASLDLPPPGWQPMAKVLRAHGTGGSVRLRFLLPIAELCAWPLVAFLATGPDTGELLPLGKLRPVGRYDALADLQGRLSREQSAQLAGKSLSLCADVLPPAQDDEIYLFALLGRPARLPAGHALGHIVAVYDHGAGPIVAISRQAPLPAQDLATLSEDLLVPLAIAPIVAAAHGAGDVVLDVPDFLLQPA